MSTQKLKNNFAQGKRQEQELLALSLLESVKQDSSPKKYLDLKGWKPCLSLFLATNYAFISCAGACESMRKPDQENLQRLFLEKSKSQQPNPLIDITNSTMPRGLKTNIPNQYLKITDKGIYLDDNLKSLEKDLFIEAAGDLYLQRLNALGNLTVSTPGRVHVLEDLMVGGLTTIKAGEIEVFKRLKSKGNIQLFAETKLGIRGYVKSKKCLQLVGVGEIDITGVTKGLEGVVLLSSGNIYQNGTVISQQEIASQSKEFSLGGTLLSHERTQIKTQEILEAKPNSSIGAKGLALVSDNNQILLHGDIYVQGRSVVNSPGLVDLTGYVKSTENIAIQSKNFSLTGVLEALNGATLFIEEEWKLPGIFRVYGSEFQGKVNKLTLEGLLATQGTSLIVDNGSNQGVMLTRGHSNLKGKKFTHHKGSIVFTTGVHQIDFTNDYQDASQFFTPTLFIAKVGHLMFLPGFEASLKDALLTSQQQITVYEGAKFNLFGPATFLQFTSDGSANFRGKAIQDSQAQFPFEKYLEALELKMTQFKVSGNNVAGIPSTADLKKEVGAMALTHPWRTLKKGQGISMVVGGDVKYAGESRLDGGSINVNATHNVQSQYGSMQSGSFTGHGVSIHGASALLDNMAIKSYLDKVTVITTESLKIKDAELSGGLQTLVSSLESDIQRSKLNSLGGEVSIEGISKAKVKDTQIESHKDTSVRGGQVGMVGSAVKSQGHAFLQSDSQLAVETSQFETRGNHYSGEDISVKQVRMTGDSTMDAKHDLSVEDLNTADHLSTRSGNKTSFNGAVVAKGLNSEAKHLENNAQLHTEGSVQLVAERLDQNREMVGESIFIQADVFNDKEASKAKALKTLVLINEKGTGISGTLEGETVVIKMDDFQLKALKQVIAKVTQLHINKDVVVDEDLLLNNTLHLWANSLIQKGKITAMGDLIAQLKEEVSLYDILDIKGTGAITAGGNFKIDRGQVNAEQLYLQSKTGDITLYKAALKAMTDLTITADEGNIKKTGSDLQAGADVHLKAGLNIESRSEVERIGAGNNFQDKKVADKVEAGGNLSQEAGGHILFTAVENKAGGNISYQAGGHILDTTVALETEYSQGDKKNYDKGTRVTQSVSKHQAGGDLSSHAGGNQELYAPEVIARRVQLSAGGNFTAHEVHDTHEHQSKETHKGGFFGQDRKKKQFSFSAISKGMQVKAAESVDITAGQNVSLTNVTSDAPKTSLTAVAGAVRLLLGKSQTSSSSMEKSSNALWQSQKSHIEEHKTLNPSSFGGALVINSKETFVESIRGQSLSFAKLIEDQGVNVVYSYLDEFHKDEIKKTQGPSAALTVVVVLAVSICTAGTGAALGAAAVGAMSASGIVATVITGMTAAGFTSLCSQAALALLSNEGDPIRAAESLASTRTLETLGISMVTAGVTAGALDALHIPQSASSATTPLDHIGRQAIQMSVNTTANMAMGQRPEDALIQGLKGAAVGIVGGVASSEIGKAYAQHDVDFIGHKFLHALVGGSTGAFLSDDPLKGAVSGAFGAVTAEMIGELVLMNSHKIATDVVNNLDEKDIPLTPENIQAAVRDELKYKTDFVKLLTSGVALLAGQDVSVATFTATTAVDNNLSHMAYQITELEVFDILERECAGIYNSAKESLLEVADFFIGDKEMPEGVQPEDDPFTTLAGGTAASGVMRGVRVLQHSRKVGLKLGQAVVQEAEEEVGKQATKTVVHGGEAHSAANRQRLGTQLRLEEEGVIDQQGRLTQQAIDQAKPIQSGSELSEHFKAFMRERSHDPSQWSKVENPQGALKLHPVSQDMHPDLRNIEVHFYKHNETGEVITIRDYKAKANPTYGIREGDGRKLDRSHAQKLLDDARKGEKK